MAKPYATELQFLKRLEEIGHEFDVEVGPGGSVLFKCEEWLDLSLLLQEAEKTVRHDERERAANSAKNAALSLERWPISEEQADEIFAEVMRAV